MKKIFGFILIFALVAAGVFCFYSCAKRDNTEISDTTSAVENGNAEKLAIVKNGSSDYIFVTADNMTVEAEKALTKFVEAIYETTGVTLKTLPQTQAMAKESSPIIIFGNTRFAETFELRSSLSPTAEAFAMKESNKNIVITSNYDTALITAVDFYIEELMEKNYDKESNTLYFESCNIEGDDTIPSPFSLKNIEKYSIIYSTKIEGFDTIAKLYQDSLKTLSGVTVPIYKDTEKPAAPYEILIGYTNRPLSEKCFLDSSRVMTYEVVVEKGDLQIAAGGPYSAKKCLYQMETDIFKFMGETLSKGSYLATDLAPVSVKISEGAELRIMTSNILAESAASENVLPVAQRLEMYCGVLLRYLPDAVGVQEADLPWSDQIPNYLSLIAKLDGVEYSCVLEKYNGAPQWEPIIYRSDKFRCDYAAYTPAEYWTNTTRYVRGVSRAKFTSLVDESLEFAIVNAHWNHNSSSRMYTDASQMSQCVYEIQYKYPNAKIFCTGDFNSHYYESKPLTRLLSNISGSLASSIAKDSGTLAVPCGCRVHGGHGSMAEGVERAYDSDFIDHVIGVGKFGVLRHDTIITNCTNLMTDHSAIYADIDFR